MKTVLVHGVFDLLHLGHIRHLSAAKALGDRLIVSVTSDPYVNKGPDRPAFTADLRVEARRALRCVDYVLVNRHATAVPTILAIRPNLYVKGPECQENQSPGLLEEIEAVRSVGGDVAYTEGQIFSSTELLRKVLSYG